MTTWALPDAIEVDPQLAAAALRSHEEAAFRNWSLLRAVAADGAIHERDARTLLQMRLAGAAYRDIMRALGYRSVAGAWGAVRKALRESLQEPGRELRALEVARLDRLLLRWWPVAISADPGAREATQTVLEVMRRRAALLGLDAPMQIDITGYVRELAIEHGLDPDQAVRDAEQIIKRADLA